MTFAQKIKNEIYSTKPLNGKHKNSFAYGLFLFSKCFSSDSVYMSSESIGVSKLYGQMVRLILGEKILPQRHISPKGNEVYTISINNKAECEKILNYFNHQQGLLNADLMCEECLPSFISGAFMACASISDPIKGYHLEFSPPSGDLGDILFEILAQMGYPPKSTIRKGHWGIYYKQSEPIEDLLTIIGATASTLELMEVKIYKDFRNKTNRQSNCDSANIDKMVDASQQQISDINFVLEHGGEDTLTEALKDIATLRLENPDSSLREIAELAGISRSGANHRLMKISQLAAELRLRKEDGNV